MPWCLFFHALRYSNNSQNALFYRFPHDLGYLCRHEPQSPSSSLSSIPRYISSNELGSDAQKSLNLLASFLSSKYRSSDDLNTFQAIGKNGNKEKDNIATSYIPLSSLEHSNENEHAKNPNNNAKNKLNNDVSKRTMNLELLSVFKQSKLE